MRRRKPDIWAFKWMGTPEEYSEVYLPSSKSNYEGPIPEQAVEPDKPIYRLLQEWSDKYGPKQDPPVFVYSMEYEPGRPPAVFLGKYTWLRSNRCGTVSQYLATSVPRRFRIGTPEEIFQTEGGFIRLSDKVRAAVRRAEVADWPQAYWGLRCAKEIELQLFRLAQLGYKLKG